MKSMKPEDAEGLYEDFHRFPPKKIGEFHPSFRIPQRVFLQGKAIHVLYRSDKVDPETLKKPRGTHDYIHDHDSVGVKTYLPDGDGELVEVPDWIRNAPALTSLGECLGFAFEDPSGHRVDAEGTSPLPELYAVQVGWLRRKAALLVVQGKREVLAVIWGGKLRVEPRGICG